MVFGIKDIVKSISLCLLVFFTLGIVPTYGQDKLIRVSDVTNEIRLGKFAGNRNMSVGVKNIIEEILLDLDYDLSPLSKQHIKIRLIFFDVKNIGSNVAVFHKNVSLTQIIAQGELYEDDKLLKKSVQKGESKEISQSTLLIAEDGTFNQQTASIALKKVCELIVKDLTQ
jgi:hypothetical protein